MTEYSYSHLTGTVLADNNIGGIIEDDVRSIVDFARVHAMSVGASYETVDISAPEGDGVTEAVAYPLASTLSTGTNVYSHNYATAGSLLSWAGSGFQYTYDAGANYPSRLFRYSWDANLSDGDTSPISAALVFYLVPYGDVWGVSPYDDGTDRVQVSYFNQQVSALRDGNDTVEMSCRGSGLILLEPGDTLVPALEYYDSGSPTPKISFNIDINSVGVADNQFTATTMGIRSEDVTQAGANGVLYDWHANSEERLTGLPLT